MPLRPACCTFKRAQIHTRLFSPHQAELEGAAAANTNVGAELDARK